MSGTIPLVDYLVLEPEPHLIASECVGCGARFLDRRTACAGCSGREFKPAALDPSGHVVTFTIVHQASPGVAVPFTAVVVDCGGTRVAANLINVAPDPELVRIGLPVRLATYSVGADADGTEALGFGFEPS
jgi:uncharacterized OB-fold protein